MNPTPYEVAEYVIKNNPKAITLFLKKYGYNPLNVAPTPALILQIIENNGELAVVDLFDAYYPIVKNIIPQYNSVEGIDFAGMFGGGGSGGGTMGPPAPTGGSGGDGKKKDIFKTFANIFGVVTAAVPAVSGVFGAIRNWRHRNDPQPGAQQYAPAPVDETIMGLSKPVFFGVVILVVVVVIAVIAKATRK
jgi:hypothetical protein